MTSSGGLHCWLCWFFGLFSRDMKLFVFHYVTSVDLYFELGLHTLWINCAYIWRILKYGILYWCPVYFAVEVVAVCRCRCHKACSCTRIQYTGFVVAKRRWSAFCKPWTWALFWDLNHGTLSLSLITLPIKVCGICSPAVKGKESVTDFEIQQTADGSYGWDVGAVSSLCS